MNKENKESLIFLALSLVVNYLLISYAYGTFNPNELTTEIKTWQCIVLVISNGIANAIIRLKF